MDFTFDYFYSTLPMFSINVEDISNFTMRMTSSEAIEFFIDVRTDLGETEIRFFGPLLVDTDQFALLDFKFEYTRMPYVEKKVITKVQNYLDKQSKYTIDNCEIVTREEFYERLEQVMKNGNGVNS